MDTPLTDSERKALVDLGRHGSAAAFDQMALGNLFVKGLVAVEPQDRRLILTAAGRQLYGQLSNGG